MGQVQAYHAHSKWCRFGFQKTKLALGQLGFESATSIGG